VLRLNIPQSHKGEAVIKQQREGLAAPTAAEVPGAVAAVPEAPGVAAVVPEAPAAAAFPSRTSHKAGGIMEATA
jgi:hypothetical protein